MEDSEQTNDHAAASQAALAEELARRAASFGAAAAAYAQHRPDYAIEAVKWAIAPVGEPAGRPIEALDLGAGTGKLTAQLASLPSGSGHVSVVAVEPDPAMIAELRRLLPGVTAVEGRAEAIPLPDESVDAVLAGQAAHWFDLEVAFPEIARVLRPGGVVAGLWNADDSEVDWVGGLHEASGRRTVVPIGGDERDDEGMTGWIDHAGANYFWPAEEAEFGHSQLRTADSLIATLGTHSAFLIMEPADRAAALAKVRGYLASTPHTASGEFALPLRTFALRAVRR
jgi:SAM-dependent methyltransferase